MKSDSALVGVTRRATILCSWLVLAGMVWVVLLHVDLGRYAPPLLLLLALDGLVLVVIVRVVWSSHRRSTRPGLMIVAAAYLAVHAWWLGASARSLRSDDVFAFVTDRELVSTVPASLSWYAGLASLVVAASLAIFLAVDRVRENHRDGNNEPGT